ncbi:hypothetical protein [Cupriavidus alkaliphilus]|uniref:hypothetical protein n=1 Tax=Cupriavidus alkaliphilus TaxID=942866 RepID=UPI00339D6287
MPDDLAIEFFFTFQRAEHALKMAGLRKNKPVAEACWTRFAREPQVTALLAADDGGPLSEAIRYYFAHPPRQQMVRDAVLVWEEKAPNPDGGAEALLAHVGRMRNNLFHGGKCAAHLYGRDRELVEHGLCILRACIEAHPEVREHFRAFTPEGQ